MDNKMLIMECAKELFYAKGYDAVGVQEIADKAGITKPTLYYYFGSKLGLLKTIMDTKFEELQIMESEAVQKNDDIREILYGVARAFCHFFEKDREFYMLMMAQFYAARENEAYQVIRPYIADLYDTVVKAFEKSSGQLGNMNGRQRQFAVGFIGTIMHYLLLHYEEDPMREKVITEHMIVSMVNQFMYGIFT